MALNRPPLDAEAFVDKMAEANVPRDLAVYLWEELQPYYFRPLTPYLSDRVYGDMKIDPDDISDIALKFEKRFGAWLGELPIRCPHDPTIVELGVSLQVLR